MRQWWTLYQHQEASLPFEWFDPATGLLYNFTTGYTFVFQLVSLDTIKFSGTSVVGAATSPNAVVGIGAGALVAAATPPGIYKALLTAHHGGTNTDMIFEDDDPPIVEILKTPV